MKSHDLKPPFWTDAMELLEEVERLRRRFFRPASSPHGCPSWEPPVDLFETDRELLIVVALVGVAPENMEIVVDGATLVIAGVRKMPEAIRRAVVHRLEIPYGYFERRIALPPGQFEVRQRSVTDGCLSLTLLKLAPPESSG